MLKNIIKKITPKFLINFYHFKLAFLGALYYGFPSRKIIVIGVTGTHGKTTTVNLAGEILEEAGYKVAVASSIKFRIAGKEQENKLKMTMPGRSFLQKFLKQAIKAGCKYAVLEVTSEGVLQSRHRFIKFDTTVFTNLFREHLERHGGIDNYRKAKAKYFKMSKGTHIINLDDDNAEYYLQFPAQKKILFTLNTPNKEMHNASLLHSSEALCREVVEAKNVEEIGKRIGFSIRGEKFNLNLIGRFNVYNAVCAVCIGLSQGVSLQVCSKALLYTKTVPGRMEEIVSEPFRVIVDYAFTPDALTKVYETLKPSDLICVLGACGGGRDKWKRKELGKIANEYCKQVIVTNEDPYDEDPMDIINQVAQGAENKAQKILDRREAINKALTLTTTGDTVIITGKGSEPWMCVEDNKKIPWDDRKVAKEELDKLQLI